MTWLASRGVETTVVFIRQVSTVCAALGGPLTNKLNELIQEGKLREVVEFEFDYERGFDVKDYLYARQIHALVSKQGYIDLGYDRKSTAIRNFLVAEEQCRSTNERLELTCLDRDVTAVLHSAARKISEVLGPEVPSIESLELFFGPGATTNVKGAVANFRRKLSSRMACSEELLPTVGELLKELPLWTSAVGTRTGFYADISDDCYEDGPIYGVDVQVSPGKLHFVPKNSKTDRPICVEPVLNSLLQKGFGSWLKRRLRRFGVNLFDQARNQALALEGSITGKLSTIDLSNASDTLSIGLVYDLLPFQWAEALSRCRTGKVVYDGLLLEQEKFSSMGNGFTFELESLIFFGLAWGVRDHLNEQGPVSVYGDDIIIPTPCYDLMDRVLSYCGFTTNSKKSFCTGPFRESCGADWFLGTDIRPFYLREEISDKVLYSFHNWAIRRGEVELASLCLQWTRRGLRLWGPDGLGDGHLVGSYFLRVPREIRRAGGEGGYFHTYVLRPKRDSRPLPFDSLIPSYSSYCGASKSMPCDPFVIRGSKGYVRRSVYTRAPFVFQRTVESTWSP
jgi:hypothetical protein